MYINLTGVLDEVWQFIVFFSPLFLILKSVCQTKLASDDRVLSQCSQYIEPSLRA